MSGICETENETQVSYQLQISTVNSFPCPANSYLEPKSVEKGGKVVRAFEGRPIIMM
jgi:hypothetical protein